MGLSLLSLGELDESKQCLLSLVRASTTDDKSRILALHASSGLAQIHLCKRSFDEAEAWCNKSRVGWKRVGGRGHPAYITCLRLSAFSSELTGNHVDAAMFDAMANESKAAPAAVDTGLEAYESLGFTIGKSRTLVTEYHKKVPDNTRKEASTKSRPFNSTKQPSSFSLAQTLASLWAFLSLPQSRPERGSLHDAAVNEDTDLIEKHLENGADIEEAEGSFDETALHVAAWFNKTSSVKCLLDHGANIEAKNTFGRTALLLAAWKGHKSTVDTLLDRGAYIEAKDHCGGNTALLKAALHGHKPIIESLIDRGANIEAKADFGYTALFKAAHRGHIPTVNCLLDHGAKLSDTALLEDALLNHGPMIDTLVDRGANIEAKDDFDYTALSNAASSGRGSHVESLLDRGANIEAKNDFVYTALLKAASEGHKSIVESLLDR